jgi:enamine deaminase RidA (YjgF/YER057c/UK114 family)
MSERRHISSGSKFEELVGYCRALVTPDPGGDWIFVSGTTGYDYATGAISDDPAEQTRQCFRNLERALHEADSALADIVRVRVFVASREVFQAAAPVIGEICRPFRPTNTTVVTALVAPEMLIEIEVTARKQLAG